MTTTAPVKPSYVGETVDVGIDVHQHTYSITARVKHVDVKRWTMAAGDRRQMSHTFVAELINTSGSETFAVVAKAHQSIWRTLDQEIGQLEGQLKSQAAADPYEATYQSVPGWGNQRLGALP
ncbi:MAG: hypothetical protein HC929_14995 [Leptolyngbyaceae cyanobacterium SM2_5_2]|nr:hypothetical protein [Leptolyngbyaceae cyanobacterium SM2_5_2]